MPPLPALPPLAFLIADALLGWLRKRQEAQRPEAAAYLGGSLVVAGGICVLFIALVGQFDDTSTRALSRQVAPLYRSGDQIVMIDEYEYDVPFYLQAEKDAWVVSDWQDAAAIAERDNWRKELYDAGQFDAAKMREVLLLPGEFVSRLCAYRGGALWVWGKMTQLLRYEFLPQEAVAFADDRRVVWRLDAARRAQLKACRDAPDSGAGATSTSTLLDMPGAAR